MRKWRFRIPGYSTSEPLTEQKVRDLSISRWAASSRGRGHAFPSALPSFRLQLGWEAPDQIHQERHRARAAAEVLQIRKMAS